MRCVVQVLRLHAFAFPLAEVAVAVAAAHPDFMPLLLARLHEVPLNPKFQILSRSHVVMCPNSVNANSKALLLVRLHQVPRCHASVLPCVQAWQRWDASSGCYYLPHSGPRCWPALQQGVSDPGQGNPPVPTQAKQAPISCEPAAACADASLKRTACGEGCPLRQVCQLAVPAIRVYPRGTAVPAHERLAALGYREKERVGAGDSMADAAEPQLESTDDFLARVQVLSAQPAVETSSRNTLQPAATCLTVPRPSAACWQFTTGIAQPDPPRSPLVPRVQIGFMQQRLPCKLCAGALCHVSFSAMMCAARSPGELKAMLHDHRGTCGCMRR